MLVVTAVLAESTVLVDETDEIMLVVLTTFPGSDP